VAELNVVTALRVESIAYGGADFVIGAGPERARRGGSMLASRLDEAAPVAMVGVAGALDERLATGDIVVASELRTTDSSYSRRLPAAPLLAAEFRRAKIQTRSGALITSPHYVRAPERAALAQSGALAVDMESAWVMDHLPNNPMAVVRSISDTSVTGPVRGGVRALGSLSSMRGPLKSWARACGTREILLASPRSFCAGVDRAIEIVERAIELYGSPVYVRRQIVHNLHVVHDLESKGAVFVEEIDEIPDGAVVVLAAHGVSPAVRDQAAARRELNVIDATCPLVAKVHYEARRFVASGFDVILIGHAEHEEVIGTVGEAPEHIRVVADIAEVEQLALDPDHPVAFLTQTTLATDETDEIVEALRQRAPEVASPPASDICYATQNRQDAVRSIARRCDLVIVVGSANSSNTARLVEVAQREGCRAELIEDVSALELGWLAGARTVGLSAGASVPDALVHEVLDSLAALGPVTVNEERTAQETVRFALPSKVR
jgi:4-hydroxy-3-methylbut-2-en-1-yl diphosphate reductase